ncbi:MAG: T9SS type A sorting domain-containing protein [Candidatus Eisenbacteria bacterium]|uniref:T9SS type A sorting domain-containing protein n=1 Tax=Eiseniibacteriota bacterium TaxID=2212470 RepID=A0A948RUU2_UNCEI|nr:T9SS type A sorting domain-containing protein [Candidatus Eisenbacteria bacterium]MBU1950514.1 T9SS type A sorting domain-containing protein [Candidatus Eisenbacteria bacterium]MBU2690951.1 T9SS type A sorting domain-containing protein [Candidatus Eisenbacteria bacterium]
MSVKVSFAIIVFAILCVISAAPVRAVDYLITGFDDKYLGAPIGTGGPEVGEPVSVSTSITATVQVSPMPTPSLRIQDIDDYYAGWARFEFLGDVEIGSGIVVMTADFWFPAYEQFYMNVRENGTSAHIFTNLAFGEDGNVRCSDANSNNGIIGTYDTGRHFPVVIFYNMDAGIYSIWLDGILAIGAEDHGVTGSGVGAVLIGCSNDADYDGIFYLDDLYVGDWLPPEIYLRANFNNKANNTYIGFGGPEFGEPVGITPFFDSGIVRYSPMPTPSLELEDKDPSAARSIQFEFFDDAEIDTGLLFLAAHFWFESLDNYFIYIRENGGASQTFTNISFGDDGMIQCYDVGGVAANFGPYEPGRVYPLLLAYDMDAGTYDVFFDDELIVEDEPHNITGYGIGGMYFGIGHDPDTTGVFYVDNIYAGAAPPPDMAACCENLNCIRLLPMDCVFRGGEAHPEWPTCVPNYCNPAGIGDVVLESGTRLMPAIPNPFTGSTLLNYRLERPGRVQIDIYDAAGRFIRSLLNIEAAQGAGSVEWDGRTHSGRPAGSGVYFGRMRTGGETVSQRMIILE